ncbi:hypothetical protein C8R47DRAFT_571169 [Mycena vitilis]|nr:hypothetical protein C8R47DRAFT_571169 [Mycena vitilis]
MRDACIRRPRLSPHRCTAVFHRTARRSPSCRCGWRSCMRYQRPQDVRSILYTDIAIPVLDAAALPRTVVPRCDIRYLDTHPGAFLRRASVGFSDTSFSMMPGQAPRRPRMRGVDAIFWLAVSVRRVRLSLAPQMAFEALSRRLSTLIDAPVRARSQFEATAVPHSSLVVLHYQLDPAMRMEAPHPRRRRWARKLPLPHPSLASAPCPVTNAGGGAQRLRLSGRMAPGERAREHARGGVDVGWLARMGAACASSAETSARWAASWGARRAREHGEGRGMRGRGRREVWTRDGDYGDRDGTRVRDRIE